jgi:putative ABC transport system substrate-binding protein
MKRREFITLLGGAAAWPLVARGQPLAMPVIGFLRFGPASANTDRVEALRAGLRQLGYVEGKNIVIEFRWAETVDQLTELAAELVRMNVDIMLPMSSTEVGPPDRRPKRSPSCSPSMPTPSASAT